MVRVGTVSSVDSVNRTARVIFSDRADMVSAHLKVLSNSPLITAAITTDGKAWGMTQTYASAPRGEVSATYTKKPPDTIHGELPVSGHSADVSVRAWLPFIGQTVVCLMIDNGDGDGFVIGGI